MRISGAFAALLVIGALVALWLVFAAPRAPRNTLEDNVFQSPAAEPLVSTQTPANTRVSIEAAKPANVDTRPGPEPTVGPAAVADPAINSLDHGDALNRSGARAEFVVVDSQGKPVVAHNTFATLWRKLGPYALQEGVSFNVARKTLDCFGVTDVGLEPGEYEIEAGFGPCGAARQPFRVDRGELAVRTLSLPNYRRIICLRFIDAQGQPVRYLYQGPKGGGPTATSETENDLPKIERQQPPKLLRDPPIGRGGRGGFGIRRSRGSGTPLYAVSKLLTDNGRFYFEVYAGTLNRIRVPLLPEIWGSDTIAIDDECTGPQWDEYVIKLNLAPDFEKLLNTRKHDADGREYDEYREGLVEDPGRRSLLATATAAAAPVRDVRDPKGLRTDETRVLLAIDGGEDLVPIVQPVDRTVVSWLPRKVGEHWVLEVSTGTEIDVILTDEKLYRGRPTRIAASGGVREVRLAPDGYATSIRVKPISPTLRAAAARARLNLNSVPNAQLLFGKLNLDSQSGSYGRALRVERGPIWCNRDLDGSFVIQTRIGPELGDALLAGGAEISASLHAAGSASEPDGGAVICNTCSPLGRVECAALAGGELTLDGRPAGVLLRATGPTQGGLPFAEGSIVPCDDLATCHALREILSRLRTDGKSIDLGVSDWDPTEDPKPDDHDDLPARTSPELDAALNTPALRGFFRANAAWYGTHLKLASDATGFMVNRNLVLTPGRKYVLFLWSASRDEMAPDAQIVFVAADSSTDLGVVALPDYR